MPGKQGCKLLLKAREPFKGAPSPTHTFKHCFIELPLKILGVGVGVGNGFRNGTLWWGKYLRAMMTAQLVCKGQEEPLQIGTRQGDLKVLCRNTLRINHVTALSMLQAAGEDLPHTLICSWKPNLQSKLQRQPISGRQPFRLKQEK